MGERKTPPEGVTGAAARTTDRSMPEAQSGSAALVFFIHEAHLLFDGASKAFLDSLTQTVRLIRSKGVGVFFVTQSPNDVPADVLAQLRNRVQHALRAFTPTTRRR
jgi:DNA helicase HerA-like ATPase